MPKITGGSLSQHREQTRTRIFDALGRLMRDAPYDTISLADIAAEAGIGRTAMYNHFSDKESVVLAFATDETTRYLDRLDEALESTSGPTEAMRTYVRQHLAMADDFHLGLGPGLYGMLSAESVSEIRKHVRMVERVIRDILYRGIAAGEFAAQDVDETVPLIHATLQVRAGSVPTEGVETFVLRALGAEAEPPPGR